MEISRIIITGTYHTYPKLLDIIYTALCFNGLHCGSGDYVPASVSGICGEQSSTYAGSPARTLYPYQYHSINSPYSFIHPTPTLHKVSK